MNWLKEQTGLLGPLFGDVRQPLAPCLEQGGDGGGVQRGIFHRLMDIRVVLRLCALTLALSALVGFAIAYAAPEVVDKVLEAFMGCPHSRKRESRPFAAPSPPGAPPARR